MKGGSLSMAAWILDGGGKVVVEFDNTAIGSPRGNVFKELLAFVNRTDSQGRVWGADQAVDRRTVLLMATRWAAEYVLREDVSTVPGSAPGTLVMIVTPGKLMLGKMPTPIAR